MVAHHCPNLQALQFSRCTVTSKVKDEPTPMYDNMLMIGENLSLDILKTLKFLKSLTIKHIAYMPPSMKFRHFCELVHTIDLESSSDLGVAVQPYRQVNEPASSPQLKQLTTATRFKTAFWSVMFDPFLTNFENLVMLTIGLTDTATDNIFAILTNAYQNLEILNIHYTTFRSVTEFKISSQGKWTISRKLYQLKLWCFKNNDAGIGANEIQLKTNLLQAWLWQLITDGDIDVKRIVGNIRKLSPGEHVRICAKF